ncbi:MAG: transketolase [Verrucomicrobia bacterium]|nr:transketolase [Verrucomicrobiota bacterium]
MSTASDFGKGAHGAALDDLVVNTIKFLAVDAVQKAESGHPGMPMGTADMAFVLWTEFKHHSPAHPQWPNRDRFVLSAGHGSMLLYSLLHLSGYDVPMEQLQQFRQWGSIKPGHPEFRVAPGVEAPTGPLGQGTGNANGMAITEKILGEMFNVPGEAPLINHWTYAIVSDGDMMEGVSHEACSLAGHLQIGKLLFLYDSNHISIEGNTSLAFSEDVGKRFEAYGWNVQRVDGHNRAAVEHAIRAAHAIPNKPHMIVATTTIAKGAPTKANTAASHGEPLGHEEVKGAKQAAGWPLEPTFLVPDRVREFFAEHKKQGELAEAEWRKRFDAWRQRHPDKAKLWDHCWSGKPLAGLGAKLPNFAGAKPSATRASGGDVLKALFATLPNLVGGSADLAPSTKTLIKEHGEFSATNHKGRNFHFGVREHGMGAILNGIAYHGGLIPFGSTFFIFSDYMRPSIRLAALSELQVIYVFTHDSIFVGEDGPTHEPIEHLASLRAMPNLCVLRPADATETAVAWTLAIEHTHQPTVLCLTRQNLPVIDRAKFAPAEGVRKGAYILWDSAPGEPELILIGTGSEVSVALEAGQTLAAKGKRVRVVSMPSWDLFEKQPADYRDNVLPPKVWAKVAIEAGATFGWDRYVGRHGKVIGMTRFGASAPAKVLAEQFGFTAANAIKVAEELLANPPPCQAKKNQ